MVTDIRGYGLLAGIDLAPAEGNGQRGYAALCALYRSGMVVRVTGDTLILAPALVAERAEIDEITDKVASVLKTI